MTIDYEIAELTANIVSGYVAGNQVVASDLPALIQSIYGAVSTLGAEPAVEPEAEAPVPAINPKKSVTNEVLFSLIDGKPYKTLKRHIERHGYTPDSYRAAFGLKPDYPMTSASYAATRSALAKSLGLGRRSKAA